MFAGIEKITLEHPGVGQNFITSYLMVVERLGFVCLYGGSATGYMRGERGRIFEDPSSHEKISALGLDEILWRRALIGTQMSSSYMKSWPKRTQHTSISLCIGIPWSRIWICTAR